MKLNKVRKRSLAFLFCITFLFLTGFTYQTEKQRVYDDAGLLTEEEKEQLEDRYREYSLEDKMDYILLTSDSSEVTDSREYAKEFYKEQGFGYNKANGDGNLLFIDMANRRVEMIDRGKCVDFVRDEEVEEILDAVTSYLSEENYFAAAENYVKETHSAFVTDAASTSGKNDKIRYLIYGVLALVTAAVVTGALVMGNKSHMTTDCYTYGKEIKVNPRTKQDRYIRTVTTATPKPKDDSDGGGGSSDSSGFGGGGRDF